jgi:hypothetical protein
VASFSHVVRCTCAPVAGAVKLADGVSVGSLNPFRPSVSNFPHRSKRSDVQMVRPMSASGLGCVKTRRRSIAKSIAAVAVSKCDVRCTPDTVLQFRVWVSSFPTIPQQKSGDGRSPAGAHQPPRQRLDRNRHRASRAPGRPGCAPPIQRSGIEGHRPQLQRSRGGPDGTRKIPIQRATSQTFLRTGLRPDRSEYHLPSLRQVSNLSLHQHGKDPATDRFAPQAAGQDARGAMAPITSWHFRNGGSQVAS